MLWQTTSACIAFYCCAQTGNTIMSRCKHTLNLLCRLLMIFSECLSIFYWLLHASAINFSFLHSIFIGRIRLCQLSVIFVMDAWSLSNLTYATLVQIIEKNNIFSYVASWSGTQKNTCYLNSLNLISAKYYAILLTNNMHCDAMSLLLFYSNLFLSHRQSTL